MNEDLDLTLDEAVAEVLGLLIGLDLQYIPELDKYQSVTRALNRALRAVATDHEWSYYTSTERVGTAQAGRSQVTIRSSVRPRLTLDDAVQLIHPETGAVIEWAYYQPRAALHKYRNMQGLWCSTTRSTIEFSRPFGRHEDGLEIHVPVIREPRMFRLPPQPEDPDDETVVVPNEIREQTVDFDYPDLVVRRAAYYYAQTNPLWQPRVQTLEANYKELMYALTERDTRFTDTPYQNEWHMGIESGITSSYPVTGRPDQGWPM